MKITLLPKAVNPDENAAISYNLSADGLTVFDIDKATGDITTKISCNQACILTNSTQFEVRYVYLTAYKRTQEPLTNWAAVSSVIKWQIFVHFLRALCGFLW